MILKGTNLVSNFLIHESLQVFLVAAAKYESSEFLKPKEFKVNSKKHLRQMLKVARNKCLLFLTKLFTRHRAYLGSSASRTKQLYPSVT